ncbi:MAG: hypothetical protein MK185_17075 [Saccharospirillaceae bacterium]|jgi:chromosome segregation ATPase|nr:hypothetical protein A3759_22340 [Thalassolituus sp. HI0120]KZZ47525.1 hypothetical protein A3759_05440 [Thalassolituus sp. HI0120]MCH2042347.1 hypothetical protein [Saccharospirillaceae bacterium]
MFGIKSTLITAGVGIAAVATMAFLWKSEELKAAKLETRLEMIRTELVQSKSNNLSLKTQLTKQNKDLARLQTLAEVNQEKINELEHDRDDARKETATAIDQINQLRSKELEMARQQPYSRGNLAHKRLSDSMQRIAGTQD